MITIFLCGDVMTGRGIDQVLPHPGNPTLHETCVVDARDYVRLAERVHGTIPIPVNYDYIWGDALTEFRRVDPDLRIINLETSVTTSDAIWRTKGIHYRMHPENVPCLTAAAIDGCVLANNHTLDWGYDGFLETLRCIEDSGIRHVGAGRNAAEASQPTIFETDRGCRVLVYAYGSRSSGVPPTWAADRDRPGVNYLPDFSDASIDQVIGDIRSTSDPDDIVVCSIHWGGNWGYEIPKGESVLARRVIDDAGVDIVHGHSSHHVKGIEVYNGKLILYGCGDFLTDYEGISGYELYRGDLTCMYFPSIDRVSHRLTRLELVPMRVEKFRLRYAEDDESSYLESVLSREGGVFGTSVTRSGRSLILQWR